MSAQTEATQPSVRCHNPSALLEMHDLTVLKYILALIAWSRLAFLPKLILHITEPRTVLHYISIFNRFRGQDAHWIFAITGQRRRDVGSRRDRRLWARLLTRCLLHMHTQLTAQADCVVGMGPGLTGWELRDVGYWVLGIAS